jgi:hypothetical protein
MPPGGGNRAAGKAITRQITSAARAQLERLKHAQDAPRTHHPGVKNGRR